MELLHFVVDSGGTSVREAADNFGKARGLARTTVLTMLERLRTKGFLARDESGRANVYRPSSPPKELMTGAVRTFVDKALGGSISPIMAYLSEQSEVSNDELEELKRLVARLDSKREDGEG